MSEPIAPATDEELADLPELLHPKVLIARIHADAAKIKALELERDTIQEYADRVGANLTAAEGTIKERDEHIARYEDLIVAQEPETWRNHPGACCCEFCEDRRAIIARRKEAVLKSGHGEGANPTPCPHQKDR